MIERPLPPDVLVDAMQDRIHRELPGGRPARSVRVMIDARPEPTYYGMGECPICGDPDATLRRRVYPDPRAALEPIACRTCWERGKVRDDA